MVRNVDPETVGTNSIPQLRPPRSYALVWADDSVRPEKALSLWKPLPHPGCASRLCHMAAAADNLELEHPRATLHPADIAHNRIVSSVLPASAKEIQCEGLSKTQAIRVWVTGLSDCAVARYEALGCVANIGIEKPSTQIVKCVRADMARSASGILKPAARLPAYRGRRVFTAWTSDERLSTFVATAEDRAPLRDDFKQLALLHEHDESLSDDANRQPQVLLSLLIVHAFSFRWVGWHA